MQLIDEDDGVLRLHQLLHDGLQPLLKLAAILRACNDQRKIERQHALVCEEARHLAVGNLLRQPFDDRGLTNARLADQHRIVLRPAAENLDDALDFVVTTDQRIKRLFARGLRQVARELGQHRLLLLLALLLAACGCRFLLCRALQLLADCRQTQPALHQDLRGEALLFAQKAEKQMFCSDVLVAQPLGLFGRVGEHVLALVGKW